MSLRHLCIECTSRPKSSISLFLIIINKTSMFVFPKNWNCENCELCAYCFRGHKVIAVTLLQHGADTTIKNNSGKKSDPLRSLSKLIDGLWTSSNILEWTQRPLIYWVFHEGKQLTSSFCIWWLFYVSSNTAFFEDTKILSARNLPLLLHASLFSCCILQDSSSASFITQQSRVFYPFP